jgi:hypothetical protein
MSGTNLLIVAFGCNRTDYDVNTDPQAAYRDDAQGHRTRKGGSRLRGSDAPRGRSFGRSSSLHLPKPRPDKVVPHNIETSNAVSARSSSTIRHLPVLKISFWQRTSLSLFIVKYSAGARRIHAGKVVTPVMSETSLPGDVDTCGQSINQYLAVLAVEATTSRSAWIPIDDLKKYLNKLPAIEPKAGPAVSSCSPGRTGAGGSTSLPKHKPNQNVSAEPNL